MHLKIRQALPGTRHIQLVPISTHERIFKYIKEKKHTLPGQSKHLIRHSGCPLVPRISISNRSSGHPPRVPAIAFPSHSGGITAYALPSVNATHASAHKLRAHLCARPR